MTLTCATSALATMPRETLLAIKGVVASTKAGLVAVKTAKEVAVLEINKSLLPLQAAKQAIDGAVTSIKESIVIVPADTVAACPELGTLNYTIGQAATAPIQAASNILFDVERLIGSKLSINVEIKQLDATITFLDEISAAIDAALSTAV